MKKGKVKNRRDIRVWQLTLTLCLVFVQTFSQAQTSQQNYLIREIQDYYNGVYSLGSNNVKAWRIYQQLVSYSGMQYPIYYSQNFNWGSAHNGGIIFLDYSSLAKSESVLAFIMAHEWGHQALGHSANIYHPTGGGWRPSRGGTSNEDAADEYAGNFLGTYNYNIESVKSFLRSSPGGGLGDTHSTGSERAETVYDGYLAITGGSRRQTSTSYTECSYCDGLGRIERTVNCSSCGGGGVVYCSWCGGNGGVNSYGYNSYGRYGYWFFPCSNCSGRGMNNCGYCNGNGIRTTRNTCNYCSGRGRVSR